MPSSKSGLDLTPFCGTGAHRSYLHNPFASGGHTFATNGHIAIRVPARDDAKPVEPKNGYIPASSGTYLLCIPKSARAEVAAALRSSMLKCFDAMVVAVEKEPS